MKRKSRNRVYEKKRKRFIGTCEVHRFSRRVSFDFPPLPAPSVSCVFVPRIHIALTMRVLRFMLLKLAEPQAKAVRLKVGTRAHPRRRDCICMHDPLFSLSLLFTLSFFRAEEIEMSISMECRNCYDTRYTNNTVKIHSLNQKTCVRFSTYC